MEVLLMQIRAALAADLYYLALYTSLTLPDICGAMSSDSGWSHEKKYVKWFDDYVASPYGYKGWFSGNDCYTFRCSLLHQGSSHHPKSRFSRIVFIEPSEATRGLHYHLNILDDALNIDVGQFCDDMVRGAQAWLQENEGTKNFEKNYEKFVRRRGNTPMPLIGPVAVVY